KDCERRRAGRNQTEVLHALPSSALVAHGIAPPIDPLQLSSEHAGKGRTCAMEHRLTAGDEESVDQRLEKRPQLFFSWSRAPPAWPAISAAAELPAISSCPTSPARQGPRARRVSG